MLPRRGAEKTKNSSFSTSLRRNDAALKNRPPILPFIRADLADIAIGQRVATFRPMKQPYYPKSGQLFKAHYARSPLPGDYRCDFIKKLTLGEARKRYWQELGAEAPEKVETLWAPLFGRSTFLEDHEGFVYLATRVA